MKYVILLACLGTGALAAPVKRVEQARGIPEEFSYTLEESHSDTPLDFIPGHLSQGGGHRTDEVKVDAAEPDKPLGQVTAAETNPKSPGKTETTANTGGKKLLTEAKVS